jgi:hypothetical protein
MAKGNDPRTKTLPPAIVGEGCDVAFWVIAFLNSNTL